MHPASTALLRYFAYDHLPKPLQEVSRPFHDLAHLVAEQLPDSPETTVCIRKLAVPRPRAPGRRAAAGQPRDDRLHPQAARGQGLRGTGGAVRRALYSVIEEHADCTVIVVRAFVPQKLADALAWAIGWRRDTWVQRSRYSPHMFVVGR